MMRVKFFVLVLIVTSFFIPRLFAEELPRLPAFESTDRVLILAPHPDDEVIGAGGAMAQAMKAGARVKVVLLTNGENNMLSFVVYKKRVILPGKDSLAMGRLRKNETVRTLKTYGLKESDILSLGYPDFGTLKILTRHWGKGKPYRSLVSYSKHVPSAGDFSPGAFYSGESILRDLTRILIDYQPTQIFVSHPADENRDHRALYLFTRIALWDLEGKINPPQIYPYLVHLDGWPSEQGFHPELKLVSPVELLESDIRWKRLTLSPEETEVKYKALQKYPSQIQYTPESLVSFARSNELFGDYAAVTLIRQTEGPVVWQKMRDYNPLLRSQKTAQQKFIAGVSYAIQQDRLLVKLELKHLRNRATGVSLVLMGYKKGVSFAEMPKIEIFTRLNYLSVKDKMKRISKKEVDVTWRGKELRMSLPLELLGSPNFILSSAKTRRVWDLSIDETAWRVLSLESRVQ